VSCEGNKGSLIVISFQFIYYSVGESPANLDIKLQSGNAGA